jgi:hypothetical protein
MGKEPTPNVAAVTRFVREVVQTQNAAKEREKLLCAFAAVSDKDERTHLHVLERGEVPSFV